MASTTVTQSGFDAKLALLRSHKDEFVSELLLLLHTADVPRASKVEILLGMFELRDSAMVEVLLSNHGHFSLPEVLATCRALDAPRRVRSLETRIAAVSAKPLVQEVIARNLEDQALAGQRRRTTVVRSRGRGRGRGRGRTTTRHVQQGPVTNRAVLRSLAKIREMKQEVVVRNGERIATLTATLCGRNALFFQAWATGIPQNTLRHYLFEFGLEPWRELADLVHINPHKLQLPYFLPVAFAEEDDTAAKGKKRPREDDDSAGSDSESEKGNRRCAGAAAARHNRKRAAGVANPLDDLPEDIRFARSLRSEARASWSDEQAALIVKHQVPLTLLRRIVPIAQWGDALKAKVAAYTETTTLLWWLEELHSPAVEALLRKRLAQNNESFGFGYGKLMERLMCCKQLRSPILHDLIPIAQQSLAQYSLPLRTPMAVLGDSSGSMQVAVRTSSIIVSLLAALAGSDTTLLFFNGECVHPPFIPRSIREVLVCAEEVVADGATAPAAALEHLYLTKTVARTVVLVTDEKENDPAPKTKLNFLPLFQKYRDEVSPTVALVLVSFLEAAEVGQLEAEFRAAGIPFVQCRLSSKRPDLTKLDQLLGKLSMETPVRVVAAEALSVALRHDAGYASQVGHFARDFVQSSGAAVVELLRHVVTTVDDASVLDLVRHVVEAAGGPAAHPAVERLATAAAQADLRASCAALWSSAEFRLGLATALSGSAAVGTAAMAGGVAPDPRSSGSLGPLQQDVLFSVLSYLDATSLESVEQVGCEALKRAAYEVKFETKFRQVRRPYEDELDAIRGMGLLGMFTEAEVLKQLGRTRGNVEHALAILFGDAR